MGADEARPCPTILFSHSPILSPLSRLAGSIGCAFRVEAIDGRAEGLCQRGEKWIAVEQVGEDFSPNSQIAAGVHELAHAFVLVDRRRTIRS
jgi:hypothetical protein